MKKFIQLLSVFFLLAIISCKKSDSVSDSNPTPPNNSQDETTVPSPESVTTSIYGLVRTEDTQDNETGVVGINYIGYNINATFNTGIAAFDKYATKMRNNSTRPGSLEFSYKTVPLTGSAINYLYAHTAKAISVGTVANNFGGSFTLSANASINFGVNAIYIPPPNLVTPGSYFPDLTAEIYSSHLNPTANNFALQLPCYSMGDKDQKRWFLRSFGAVNLLLKSRNYSSGSNVSFYNGARGSLQMTIPASLSSAAPDSVEKWVFRDGLWQSRGYARKVGNTYVGDIDTVSIWNFATPVKGIYRTIQLHTDSGTAVINATVRIKNGTTTLAESQTDADGNALCFLPSNENLTIEIFNRWNLLVDQNPIKTVTIPATNNAATIDISLNSSHNQVYTFKGNATNCDGSPIAKGIITLSSYVNYVGVGTIYIPVANGKYNGSFILNTVDTSSRQLYIVSAKNIETNIKGSDTTVIIKVGKPNVNHLNICPPQTNLFMNIVLENGPTYSITGDFSTPFNPNLTGSYSNNYSTTTISGENAAGEGLEFSVYAYGPGVYNGIGNTIFINRVLYFTVPNGLSKVTFERFDLLPNSYIKGNAEIYYKDNNNVTKKVTTSFKVKRIV